MTAPDAALFADLTPAQRASIIRTIHVIGAEMHKALDRALDEATRDAIKESARKRVIVEVVRLRLVAKAVGN